MRRVTPLSLMEVTENANNVSQTSLATSAVRFCKSTRSKSPDRVEIELVGSEGTFRTSKQMVKQLVR